MNYYNYTFNTETEVTRQLNKLIDLAGKKRIQKLMSIWMNDNNIKVRSMIVKYERSKFDCFEMSKFHDRITNKGFQRHSTDAIDNFCSLLIDVLNSAKKLNLIK